MVLVIIRLQPLQTRSSTSDRESSGTMESSSILFWVQPTFIPSLRSCSLRGSSSRSAFKKQVPINKVYQYTAHIRCGIDRGRYRTRHGDFACVTVRVTEAQLLGARVS